MKLSQIHVDFRFLIICLSLGFQQPGHHQVNAGNILGLFPHYGFSHFKVFYPIMRGLAEQGHNVTVVTYTPSLDSPLSNYHELLLKGKPTVNAFTLNLFQPERSLPILWNEYTLLHQEGQAACERFYESGHVEDLLKRHSETPYDLVIAEYFNTDCYLGVPYLMDVPVVGLSSCALMPWYYDRILLPDTASFVQSEFIGFPEELAWHDRFVNFVQSKTLKYLYRYITNYYDAKVIKKYLNVDVDVNEVAKRLTSLVFVNQHYSLMGNRPHTYQYVEMGGIHIADKDLNEPLPEEVARFLDQEDTQSVLFISWGSMLKSASLDKPRVLAIIKALQKLPLKVIWKWENEEKPLLNSPQFLFIKWAPQLRLLCHPKVKYFWGHGGLLGTTEAVFCGKPLMVTPIYGDQFLNAYAVKNRRVGVILYYKDIDLNHVTLSLHELMRPRYIENALALSQVFRKRQHAPLETALWWIQHILEHGKLAKDLLQTKAVHLHWIHYYCLDSMALLALMAVVFFCLVYFLWRLVCGRFSRGRTQLAHKVKVK